MNPISSSTSPSSPSSLSSSTITELAAALLADGRFHQQYQQNISHHRADHQQQKSASPFIRSMTREFVNQHHPHPHPHPHPHHHHNHHQYNHNISQSLSNSSCSSSSSSSSSTMNENQLAMAAAHISLLQKYRQQQQQQQQQDQQNSVTSHQQLLNSMDHFSRMPRLAMNGNVGNVGCPTFGTNLPSHHHHQPFPRLNQWMNDPFMSPPSTAALPPTKSSFPGDFQSLLSRRNSGHSNGEDLMETNDDLLLNIQPNMLDPALFYGPTATAPASHYYHGIGSTGSISSPYSSGPTNAQPNSISSLASMIPPTSVKSSLSAASQRPNPSSTPSMFNNSNQRKMVHATPNKNTQEQQSLLTSPLSSASMVRCHDSNYSCSNISYSGPIVPATATMTTNHNNTGPVMSKQQKQLSDPSSPSSSLLFNIKHEETSCNSPYSFWQKPQQSSNHHNNNSSSEHLNQTKSQLKQLQQSMADRSIKRSPSLEAINPRQQCDESIMPRLPPFSSITANNNRNHLTLANNNLPFEDAQHQQQHKPYPYSMNVFESDADDYILGTQNNQNQTMIPSNNLMVQRQNHHQFNNNNNKNGNNLPTLSSYLDEMAKMTARHHPESQPRSLNSSSSSLLLAATATANQQQHHHHHHQQQYHFGDTTSSAASLSNQNHHHNHRSKVDHGGEVSLLSRQNKHRGRPKKNPCSNTDSSILSPTLLEPFNGQSLPSINTFFDTTTSTSSSNLVLNSPPPFLPHSRPTTSSKLNFDFNNVPAFPGVPNAYSVPVCKEEYSAEPKRLDSDSVQHLPLASHHQIQQLPKPTHCGKRPRGRPKMNETSDQNGGRSKFPKSSLSSEASWSAIQSSLASILPGFSANNVTPVVKRGRGRPKSLKTMLKEVQSAGHQLPQEMIQTLLAANQSKIPRSNQQKPPQPKDKQHSGLDFYGHQRLPPPQPHSKFQPKFHPTTDDSLSVITDATSSRYDNCPEPQPGLVPSSSHHHHHHHHHSRPLQNQPTPSYHHSPIRDSYYPEMAALSPPPSLAPSTKFCSSVPSLLPPPLLSPEKPPKLPSCGAIFGETEIVKNPFDDLDEMDQKPNRIMQSLRQNGYIPIGKPPPIEDDHVAIPVRSSPEPTEIAQPQQLVAPIKITLNGDSTFRCMAIDPNETRIPKQTKPAEKVESLGPTSRSPAESSSIEDDDEDRTENDDETSSYSVPSFLEDTSDDDDDDDYDDDWLNGYDSNKTKRRKLQNPQEENGCSGGRSNQSATGSGTIIDSRPRSSQIQEKTDQKRRRTRQSYRPSGKPKFTEALMLQTLNNARSLFETDSGLNEHDQNDDLCDNDSHESSNHLHDDDVDSRFEAKNVETKESSGEISPVDDRPEQPSEIDLNLPKLPKLRLKRLNSDSGQANLFKIIQQESSTDIDDGDDGDAGGDDDFDDGDDDVDDGVLKQPEQNENASPAKESSPPLEIQSNSCDELVKKNDLVETPVISDTVDLVQPQPIIEDDPELTLDAVPEEFETSTESGSIEQIQPIKDVIPVEEPLVNTDDDDNRLFRTPSPPPAFEQHTGISAIFPSGQSSSSSHHHQRSTLDSLMPINGLINSFSNENKLISDNEQFSAINSIMNFDDDQSTDQSDAIELNPLISQVSMDLVRFSNDDDVDDDDDDDDDVDDDVEEPESGEQIETVQETGFTKEEIHEEMMSSTIISADDQPEKEMKIETIPNSQDLTNNEESEQNIPETEENDCKQDDYVPSPITNSFVNDDLEKLDEFLPKLERHSPTPEDQMEQQKSPPSITLLSPCDPNGLSSSTTTITPTTNPMVDEHQDSVAEPFASFQPQTILPFSPIIVPNQNTNPVLSSRVSDDGNDTDSIQTSPAIIAQTITPSTVTGSTNSSNPTTMINPTNNLMPTFQSNYQQPNTVPIMKPVIRSHLGITGNFSNQAPCQPQIPAPVPSVQIYSNFVQQQPPPPPAPPTAPQQHRFPIMLSPNAAIRFLGPNGQPIHPGISNQTPMMPQPQTILVSNPQGLSAGFHQIGSQQPFMFRPPQQLYQPQASQPMIATQSANGSMINFILPNQPGLFRTGPPANPSNAANINPIFIRHGQRLIPMNPAQLLNLRMLNQNQTLLMSPSSAPAPQPQPSLSGTSANIFQAPNIIPQAQFVPTPPPMRPQPIPTNKIIVEAKQPLLIRKKLHENSPLKTDESLQPKDILTAAMEEISFDDLDDNHREPTPVSDNSDNANRNSIPTASPTMMVFNNQIRMPMVQIISMNNLVPTPTLNGSTASNNRIPPPNNPAQANPPANNAAQLTNDDLDRLFSDDMDFSAHFDEDFKFFDEIGESVPSQTNSASEISVEPKIEPSPKHRDSIDQTQPPSEEPDSGLIAPIVQQMVDEIISNNDIRILSCDKSDSNPIQSVSGIIEDLLGNLSDEREPEKGQNKEEQEIKVEFEIGITEANKVLSLVDYDSDDSAEAIGLEIKDEEIETGSSNRIVEKIETIFRIQTNVCRSEPILTPAKLFSWDSVKPLVPEGSLIKINSYPNEICKIESTCEDIVKKLIDSTLLFENNDQVVSRTCFSNETESDSMEMEENGSPTRGCSSETDVNDSKLDRSQNDQPGRKTDDDLSRVPSNFSCSKIEKSLEDLEFPFPKDTKSHYHYASLQTSPPLQSIISEKLPRIRTKSLCMADDIPISRSTKTTTKEDVQHPDISSSVDDEQPNGYDCFQDGKTPSTSCCIHHHHHHHHHHFTPSECAKLSPRACHQCPLDDDKDSTDDTSAASVSTKFEQAKKRKIRLAQKSTTTVSINFNTEIVLNSNAKNATTTIIHINRNGNNMSEDESSKIVACGHDDDDVENPEITDDSS